MARRLLPVVAAASLLGRTAADEGSSSFDIGPSVDLAQDIVERYMGLSLPPSDQRAQSEEAADNETGEGSQPPAAGEADSSAAAPSSANSNGGEEDKNLTYDGSDLIEWINANGGLIHPNIRIGLDPTGQYRGVFVKTVEEGGTEEGIDEGDITARVPWDLIVKPKEYAPNVYWNCEALHELYRQFQLGDDSPYAPYINYLKNQPRGRASWSEFSDAGQSLLHKILDHNEEDDDDVSGLPPRHPNKDFTDTYLGECKGENTDLARAAFYQFTSRDEDTLMIPFFDMHNHSNHPQKLNSLPFKPAKAGKPFVMRTTRRVKPGEQLLISYNRCNRQWYDETFEGCTSHSHYGTSHLFDVFGFVEDFPQSWDFRMHIEVDGEERWDDLAFYLEKSDDGKRLLVTFGDNYTEDPDSEKPIRENIVYLGKQLLRLKELETTLKEDKEIMEAVPPYEWETAWRYHEALMTAISSAILASDFALVDSNDDAGGSEDESEDDSASEDESGDSASGDGSGDSEDRHDEL